MMRGFSEIFRANGGYELNRVVGAFASRQPRPSLAPLDLADRTLRHTKSTRKGALRFRRVHYRAHLFWRQLIDAVPLAARVRVVSQFIAFIFTRGCPPQVSRTIIEPVSVNVGYVVPGRGGKPNKRLRDEAVNIVILDMAIHRQIDAMVSPPRPCWSRRKNAPNNHPRLRAGARLGPSNAPLRASLVVRRAVYRFPSLAGINGCSHIASPISVVVRPARCSTTVAGRLFPSRFTVRSQLRRAP